MGQIGEDLVVDDELDLMFESARVLQNATLERILRDNVGCEYLTKRHGFEPEKMHHHHDFKNTFKQFVPISDYQDIHDYVERIADGDESPLLCNYPVIHFTISTGTTAGKSKKFACTAPYEENDHRSEGYIRTMAKRLGMREFCERKEKVENPKVLLLYVSGKQFRTKAGHAVRSAITHYYRSQSFQKIYSENVFCSPIEVLVSQDPAQALYCHLLCGLLHSKDVWCIDGGLSFNLNFALTFLTASWQRLCSDIRQGELSPEVTDPGLRQAVGRKLKADPELADRIEKECRGSCSCSWEGIVRKLWPNAVMINCAVSGPTLKSYLPRINFCTGNLPIYGIAYGVSEGGRLAVAISLQRNPADEALYAFLPGVAFFEFIPVQKINVDKDEQGRLVGGSNFVYSSEEMRTVEFDGVKIGEYYQPVTTNFQGMYRYKLSDIIKIKGFKGESPIFEFICRKDAVLSVICDKTDEAELQIVMEKASAFLQKHSFSIADYTSSANKSCSPGHYVIFVELGKPHTGEQQQKNQEEVEQNMVLQECCTIIDGSFNHTYIDYRKQGKIGALQLCILQSGTFKMVLEDKLSKGSCFSQYKPSRAMPWESQLITHIIRPRVLKSYTSCLHEWSIFPSRNKLV